MAVYACGSNAFGQLADVDDLVFENFIEIRSSSDRVAATSLLDVSWSQTILSGAGDGLAVLGPQPPTQVSRAKCWLGQEAFVAALLEDGHLLRCSDGAKSSERYAHADMNGRGELVLVPEGSLDVALLVATLDQVFEAPMKCIALRLPAPDSAMPAATTSSATMRRDEQITAVASGAAHFILLTSTGRVLSYGDNRYGQAGPFPSSPFPASAAAAVLDHLAFFDGLFPVALACGAFHSVVVTKDGSAYSFGSDKDGQRGGGAAPGSGDEPELLELVLEDAQSTDEVEDREEEIEQVACGAAHTVLLTRSGRIC
ncbi:hypothetical protein BMF94_1334 [Rhodotorula taiwanensis]|uniref:Uncharacterized protein n=1 Tax=Rhodotorula taiwanensis TaxID=741276 RepID=A0A2S5BG25_9BASI|nr:hypothetical protein BMF94_1334 [Rhodotorula taiwanensis]